MTSCCNCLSAAKNLVGTQCQDELTVSCEVTQTQLSSSVNIRGKTLGCRVWIHFLRGYPSKYIFNLMYLIVLAMHVKSFLLHITKNVLFGFCHFHLVVIKPESDIWIYDSIIEVCSEI